MVFSEGFSKKDQIQLYGLPVLFLFLLYNSPSGLVIYWTGNNVFSLVKNLVYVYFAGKNKKEFIPDENQENKKNTVIFILSLLVLFLLGGYVIPSSLISSSVQEFSFIGKYESPFPFIANVMMQSAGIFLLWPMCIYLLFSRNIKRKLEQVAAVLAYAAVVNVFLFPGNYGLIGIRFIFSDKVGASNVIYMFNLIVNASVVVLVLLLVERIRRLTVAGLTVIVCSLLVVGTINSININKNFLAHKVRLERIKFSIVKKPEPVFQFSETGKNVLIIALDMALPGYIPYIFGEKPELNDSFDGFTWYNNTTSFGGNTWMGAASVLGGYEYTPLEMQKRKENLIYDDHIKALMLMPRIFLDQGFNVTVTDLPFVELNIFDDYPQINTKEIENSYTAHWLQNNEIIDQLAQINQLHTFQIIESSLIRFAFFRCIPQLFRSFVYDNGRWLTMSKTQEEVNKEFTVKTLETYINLDVLPDITNTTEGKVDTYNVLWNRLTHEPGFFQAPDYVPSYYITNKGSGPFANEQHYHVNMTALLLLGKWFDYLKHNDVYDNTRIIIVSDHGGLYEAKTPNKQILPSGQTLDRHHGLLMVKNFGTHGSLQVSQSFMTIADVPMIALDGIIEAPVNPWTGKVMVEDKNEGAIITTARAGFVTLDNTYQYASVKPEDWLHVHTDIFNIENWSWVKPEY
ncbi:MAG: hypothetical protein LBH07_00170 [Treponema sp.]|nr:hypothetical protein [Treponema sp.]